MNTYTIENTTSGHIIGDYDGETREHAIAAMLRDAGYRADVVDGDVETDCPNWNGGNDLAATRCPMTASEQGEHDAEQRAHEALAAGPDGAEWQSEADAVDGWGEYAATAAAHLGVPADERAAWCDAYETAARETARRMYRDAQS